MRCKILLGLLGMGCSMAWAQTTLLTRSADLNKQDRKCVAQVAALQKQIDGLEKAIASRQQAIEATGRRASAKARDSMPSLRPGPAIVLNINGSTFILNSGAKGDGLRKDDKLLIVRRAQGSWIIDGTGVVDRAYDTDSEGHGIKNNGIRPEDEAYVLNRRSSPHDVSHLGF